MNIAIVGAGRIGSTFAFWLSRAGHAVTVIARGARLAELQRDGAIVTVKGDRADVQVATALAPTIAFDLVLVTVLAHQVDAVLPELKASSATTVLFMFNTFEKGDRLREAVGAARYASGFPQMIAFLKDGRLKSQVEGPGMVTVLSNAEWAGILKKAGMPTEVEPDMDSFLRSHVAFVVPLMAAGLLTWQRTTNLTWAEAKKLTVALIEAFEVVRGLGHSLKPGAVALVAKLPSFFLTALVFVAGRSAATRNLGEFGPGETRSLIDSMTAAAPGKTVQLLAIRP